MICIKCLSKMGMTHDYENEGKTYDCPECNTHGTMTRIFVPDKGIPSIFGFNHSLGVTTWTKLTKHGQDILFDRVKEKVIFN